MASVWISGEFFDEESATISAKDSGLLHAIGVFTTMHAKSGQVLRLDKHLKRLRESCDTLFIPLLFTDDELNIAVDDLLKANDLQDARLRLTITRGTTINDPLHGLHAKPTALLTAGAYEPYPADYYASGLTAIVLDQQKLNPYDIQAGHKTLDYFSRLSALREANVRGAGEALWFNVHNFLQSGSISNVYIVKSGTIITPPTNEELNDPSVREQTAYPKSNVLPGTTRAAVLELAQSAGIAVKLASISIQDLLDADEAFLTNSIMGVMPLCRIERKPIGNEKPGPITKAVSAGVEN